MTTETKKMFFTPESESSFNLNCFDDDFDKHLEKINEYYEYLETHSFIELDWKCPGRKSIQQKVEEKVTPVFETPPKESGQAKNMEFDFEDEPSSAVKFGMNTPNRTPKTLSGNKKKTVTTFNSVMEKIKKQHGTPK